jgi:hypothetical protein
MQQAMHMVCGPLTWPKWPGQVARMLVSCLKHQPSVLLGQQQHKQLLVSRDVSDTAEACA